MRSIGQNCEDGRCRTGRLPVCPGHLAIAALLIWLGVEAAQRAMRDDSPEPAPVAVTAPEAATQ